MGEKNRLWSIVIRYLILVVIAIPGFNIFYYLFSPGTVLPVYWIINLFYSPLLLDTSILVNGMYIDIIGACVAGAAYYLLIILNLSVPSIGLHKRIKMLIFAFASFLVINILRISILGIMFVEGSVFFDFTHKLFWYIGTTIFVIVIWFAEVKIFKIKGIPFYTDLKYYI